MNIDHRVEPWLIKLLEGVQNSNNAAEVVATAAYDAMRQSGFGNAYDAIRIEEAADAAEDATATLHAEFRRCLLSVSYARAGWDVREMPPAQKSSEAATASDAMMRARQIWAENPDKRASFRGVFLDVEPLVEMREIERAP